MKNRMWHGAGHAFGEFFELCVWRIVRENCGLVNWQSLLPPLSCPHQDKHAQDKSRKIPVTVNDVEKEVSALEKSANKVTFINISFRYSSKNRIQSSSPRMPQNETLLHLLTEYIGSLVDPQSPSLRWQRDYWPS